MGRARLVAALSDPAFRTNRAGPTPRHQQTHNLRQTARRTKPALARRLRLASSVGRAELLSAKPVAAVSTSSSRCRA